MKTNFFLGTDLEIFHKRDLATPVILVVVG